MCFPAIGAAMLGYGSAGAATAATGITATGLGIMAGTTALGVATPVVSAIGQRQQAKAQMQFQEQQRQAALQKQGLQRTSMLLEQSQEQEALAQREGYLAGMYKAASATEVARGAVAQSSAIQQELRSQLGKDLSMLGRQKELVGLKYSLGAQELSLAAQQELLSLSQPIETESPLVTSLKALSGGLSGMSSGLAIGRGLGPGSGVTQSPVRGVSRGGMGGTYLRGGYKLT
jgi:hypothetical protein